MVWYNGYTVNDADYAGEQVVELITENPPLPVWTQ